MIVKSASVILTKEEVESPEPISIALQIGIEGEEGSIEYTIDYPKENVTLPSIDDITNFLATDEECQKILNKKVGK